MKTPNLKKPCKNCDEEGKCTCNTRKTIKASECQDFIERNKDILNKLADV